MSQKRNISASHGKRKKKVKREAPRGAVQYPNDLNDCNMIYFDYFGSMVMASKHLVQCSNFLQTLQESHEDEKKPMKVKISLHLGLSTTQFFKLIFFLELCASGSPAMEDIFKMFSFQAIYTFLNYLGCTNMMTQMTDNLRKAITTDPRVCLVPLTAKERFEDLMFAINTSRTCSDADILCLAKLLLSTRRNRISYYTSMCKAVSESRYVLAKSEFVHRLFIGTLHLYFPPQPQPAQMNSSDNSVSDQA